MRISFPSMISAFILRHRPRRLNRCLNTGYAKGSFARKLQKVPAAESMLLVPVEGAGIYGISGQGNSVDLSEIFFIDEPSFLLYIYK